jgi:hypothetical protein
MRDAEQEKADWVTWLDEWERDIWPIFRRRSIEKDTAALIYFTRFPQTDVAGDDDPGYCP